MKAAAFSYARPQTLGEALDLLARHGEAAKPIAGGQSLVPALNLRLSAPELLIDIFRLPELRGVGVAGGTLRLGALTRHAELLTAPDVAAHAPLLIRAAAHIAHPAIRSRGTLGGSLANADPAAELPACMLALNARIIAESTARGRRSIPAGSFFTGLFATALAHDELLVAVEIDLPGPGACAGFAELARRNGDYAMIGLAAQGEMDGQRFSSLRLAYFSAGPVALLARGAAARLVEHGLEAAELALADDLVPHDDLQASAATRLHLARVLLRRVVGGMRP